MRNYGFNKIIRQYTKFPWYLPLPAHMEHGWTVLSNAAISDLAFDEPLMLVFSKRREKAWKAASKTPVEVMGAPFTIYKKLHGIKLKKDAVGTVVFPGHSTYDLKSRYSIENLCHQLKSLPKEFQPVTICLFWLDFIDKRANIYRQHGFRVVSAGPMISNSLSFVKNFYEILSSHKYAASNEVGSYTLYAVDLGLPFFLIGEKTILENKGKKDVNVAESSSQEDTTYGKKVVSLFTTGPLTSIKPEQTQFVAEETGLNDRLTSDQMRTLFFKYLKQNDYLRKRAFMHFLESVSHTLIFNMPWTSCLMRFRKLLADRKGVK
jgi:hypothetical protein